VGENRRDRKATGVSVECFHLPRLSHYWFTGDSLVLAVRPVAHITNQNKAVLWPMHSFADITVFSHIAVATALQSRPGRQSNDEKCRNGDDSDWWHRRPLVVIAFTCSTFANCTVFKMDDLGTLSLLIDLAITWSASVAAGVDAL
jgi:hypothetical protein